jgi:molecular chaperone HtpG
MSENVMHSEKHEFKAEIKQLLDILVHSLYTSREIFMRELISNASDALDKVRFEMRRGTEVKDKDSALEIKIGFNENEKILTISDTGIGMTKSEIIENIGTIAKSGTSDFLKKLADSKGDMNNIIGKFGVGFYSVFMVAEEVIIKTQSYQADQKSIQWKSNGLGDYEISELDEVLPRGSVIEIHLKEDAKEFAEKYRLENIIKKHSNFISFPIYLENEKINTQSAIWREPKSSVTKEQYIEFYKFLSFESDEPMDIIHNTVDAPIQFTSLLYIPKKNLDWMGFSKQNYGLDLYVRRVLIQHKNKDLIPEYMSFIKGVVDSEDLPLNISRETLQENVVFTKISNTIVKNIYSYLSDKAKNNPEEYIEFWKEHGKVFKLGYGDYSNQEKFSQLLRFNSSNNTNDKEFISLEDYTTRIKENQKEIYYVSGSSRESIELDPHLEIFKKKGLEVLYLYDPIDEFIITSIRKFKDFDFKSIDSLDVDKLEKFSDINKSEEKTTPLDSDDEKHFESLLSKIKDILGEKVLEVKVSKRLVGNAVCLVNPDDSMSSSFKKILKMANKDLSIEKKILEINKDHKLIRNLLTVYKANPTDDYIPHVVDQLFESALLLEGSLMDPHNLVNRINKYLEQSSDWYLKAK